MKILLVGINSKYIHTNLAIYYLKDYADAYLDKDKGIEVKTIEFSINNLESNILKAIYEEKADVVAFSTYVWNTNYVFNLVRSLRKISDAKIWLGGPEVSYDAPFILENNKEVDVIMKGEGEETFIDLINKTVLGEDYRSVLGITYRDGEDIIDSNERMPIDMDKLIYTYSNRLDDMKNKIIYYESSKGCPFNCSYCMSSIDKKVRYKSLDKVFSEIGLLLDAKVKQVKFVDRTFNCDKKRTMAIWQFLKDNDNGITNFHFELAIEIFDEEMAKLLNSLRKNQVQCEIGVQTTNQTTLKEINRRNDMDLIKRHVKMIQDGKNIHVHLDLIAGLPFEDLESFKNSFCDVYNMKPDCLQLGFLKVLKGTKMHLKAKEYGLVYRDEAPYEVLKTNWISFSDIIKLKEIEELVDSYYNSGRYTKTLRFIIKEFENPYDMFDKFSSFYKKNEYYDVNHSIAKQCNILYDFIIEYTNLDKVVVENIMRFELYNNERPSKEPEFMKLARHEDEFKKLIRAKEKELKEEKKLALKNLFDKYDIDIEKYDNSLEIEYKETTALFEYDVENIDGTKITYNII